mgnify:CR=1 FL=1
MSSQVPANIQAGSTPNQIQTTDPLSIIQIAIERGASPDSLRSLLDLQERFEAGQARKAFYDAMSAARAEIKPVAKARKVDFSSSRGRTNYNYEDLAGISAQVDQILAAHGLSYRFRTAKDTDGGITVSCIISHRLGHSEENSLSGRPDDSGNKNSIQAVGSTVTYLQRYTLKAALGLAASNDTDGITAGDGSASKTIDDAQFRYLSDLIEQTGSDEEKLLAYVKAPSMEDLTQAQYRTAEAMLRKKKSMQSAKQDGGK